MSADLSELTGLTATMSLHHASVHTRSGSNTPAENSETSSADRTPESESYDLDPAAHTTSASDEERETKAGEKQRTSPGVRRNLDPTERRTVFIPNLPRDASQREVTNLFAFADGFLKAQIYDQLKPQNGQTSEGRTDHTAANGNGHGVSPGETTGLTRFGAFVLFDTHTAALVARDRVNGLVFDAAATPPVTLQARLAMKNLFISREEQVAISAKSSRRGSGSAVHGPVIPPNSTSTNGVEYQNMNIFAPLLHQHHHQQHQASTPPFSPYVPASGYHSPALGAYAGVLPPPSIGNGMNGFYDMASVPTSPQHSPQSAAHAAQIQAAFSAMAGQMPGAYPTNGHYARNGMYPSAGAYHSGHHVGGGHHHGHHNGAGYGVGPNNAPCNTLFLARLEQLTNEELYQLLVNSFPTMVDHKFLIDSKGQRIAFVEFDTIESAGVALQRINGAFGLACAFSKNPLNVRK